MASAVANNEAMKRSRPEDCSSEGDKADEARDAVERVFLEDTQQGPQSFHEAVACLMAGLPRQDEVMSACEALAHTAMGGEDAAGTAT